MPLDFTPATTLCGSIAVACSSDCAGALSYPFVGNGGERDNCTPLYQRAVVSSPEAEWLCIWGLGCHRFMVSLA